MTTPYQAGRYPTYAGGAAPFRITGSRGKDQRGLNQALGDQYSRSSGIAGNLDDMIADLLGGGTSGLAPYTNAAQATLAPLQRNFNDTVGKVGANIASRFGGNASSEEERVTRGYADDFSRNLTEAAMRVGPQAIGQLSSTRNMYGGESLDIAQLIQAALAKQSKNPWSKILGTAAGIGASFIPGVGQVAGPAILAASR